MNCFGRSSFERLAHDFRNSGQDRSLVGLRRKIKKLFATVLCYHQFLAAINSSSTLGSGLLSKIAEVSFAQGGTCGPKPCFYPKPSVFGSFPLTVVFLRYLYRLDRDIQTVMVWLKFDPNRSV